MEDNCIVFVIFLAHFEDLADCVDLNLVYGIEFRRTGFHCILYLLLFFFLPANLVQWLLSMRLGIQLRMLGLSRACLLFLAQLEFFFELFLEIEIGAYISGIFV